MCVCVCDSLSLYRFIAVDPCSVVKRGVTDAECVDSLSVVPIIIYAVLCTCEVCFQM